MTRAPIFRPEAEVEALNARGWYESRRSGLGKEFAQELDATLTRIIDNPLAFPRVWGEIRRAVLRRFPYGIYFRLADGDVVVLAIHGRQDPARWQKRS